LTSRLQPDWPLHCVSIVNPCFRDHLPRWTPPDTHIIHTSTYNWG